MPDFLWNQIFLPAWRIVPPLWWIVLVVPVGLWMEHKGWWE